MALAPVAECLDEETIAAFVAGSLDAALLARVEAHVARCAGCEQVVADAAHGAIGNTSARERLASSGEVARAPASVRWATPPPQPGDVLAGKYQVERVLGQGGMGTVLSALHLELGNRVAIKVLHFGGSAAAARFLREAQTCAKLANDHIVRAFDLGRLPGGAPYLVMEYLVGEDLSRLIARGPVPSADAVKYVLEACEALADAHAAGIVHRDLKPANLFLATRPSGRPTIKLLDFGISKLVGSTDGGDVNFTLTSTGTVLGSPLYMSPEQIRASKEIDERTDIWALGVILYELLTGRVPFHAPTFSSLSVAIATDAPAPPSSLRPDIAPGLEAVVMRCLQKDQRARFGSIVELAQALRTSSDSPRPASAQKSRGAPRALLGVALALVFVLAGFVLLRGEQPTTASESPAPSAPARSRSIEASRAEAERTAPATLPPRRDPVSPAPSASTSGKSVAPAPRSPSSASPARSVSRPPMSKVPKPDPTGSPD